MGRRLTLLAWVGAILVLIVLSTEPVDRLAVRVGWLAALGTSLGLAWMLWPRSRVVRVATIAVIAVPVVLLSLPGRPFSRDALRAASVDELRSFEETPYVWGGEGRGGIDCSGLVRQALVRASLTKGVTSANGDLIRAAASLWWFDASARALRDGHRGTTRLLFESPSLNAVPTAKLEPGDFAVTSNGVHVLAYLGDDRWIQADPGAGKVVTGGTPSDDPWFRVPVHVMRWTLAE